VYCTLIDNLRRCLRTPVHFCTTGRALCCRLAQMPCFDLCKRSSGWLLKIASQMWRPQYARIGAAYEDAFVNGSFFLLQRVSVGLPGSQGSPKCKMGGPLRHFLGHLRDGHTVSSTFLTPLADSQNPKNGTRTKAVRNVPPRECPFALIQGALGFPA
jgi:hypothetical protein